MSTPSSDLLLSLADTPSDGTPSARATQPDDCTRMLNTAGRWAVRGTTQAPLLAWASSDAAAAQSAAESAARLRGQRVTVVSGGQASWVEGRDFQFFGTALEAALGTPSVQGEARTRRLRTEAEKLEAYCMVVRAASAAADQAAFAEVGRAASKALRAKFGGGSITTAFAWLAGSAGQAALQSVLLGEVELAGARLSLRQMVEAVGLATQAERLREGG